MKNSPIIDALQPRFKSLIEPDSIQTLYEVHTSHKKYGITTYYVTEQLAKVWPKLNYRAQKIVIDDFDGLSDSQVRQNAAYTLAGLGLGFVTLSYYGWVEMKDSPNAKIRAAYEKRNNWTEENVIPKFRSGINTLRNIIKPDALAEAKELDFDLSSFHRSPDVKIFSDFDRRKGYIDPKKYKIETRKRLYRVSRKLPYQKERHSYLMTFPVFNEWKNLNRFEKELLTTSPSIEGHSPANMQTAAYKLAEAGLVYLLPNFDKYMSPEGKEWLSKNTLQINMKGTKQTVIKPQYQHGTAYNARAARQYRIPILMVHPKPPAAIFGWGTRPSKPDYEKYYVLGEDKKTQ